MVQRYRLHFRGTEYFTDVVYLNHIVLWEQIEAIARDKMPDLNCFTVEAAMRMVAGTARSMGINVKGEFPKK